MANPGDSKTLMMDRSALPNFGRHVYGLAAIALGLIGLVWGAFTTIYWPVQAPAVWGIQIPDRGTLAYIVAAALLLGGVATQWRRSAQAGIFMLIVLYLMSALLWVPRIVGYPLIFGTWAGFFQQFASVAAGVLAYGLLRSRESARAVTIARIARFLFGICVISFGFAHVFGLAEATRLVPNWIPPGQQFWAIVTAIAFLAAGIAILSGVLAVLASRLLTVMFVVFGVLIWAPQLLTYPHALAAWGGNAANLAAIGGAWVVCDWIASLQKQPQISRTSS